jgi:hypothetical protein
MTHPRRAKKATTFGELVAFIYDQALRITRDSAAAGEIVARTLQRLALRGQVPGLARELKALAAVH